MIHVTHPAAEPGGPGPQLEAWRQRADAATARVIDEWARTGTVTFRTADENLWKELRDELFETVFHRKCAYCERHIFKEVPDSEHYRPKKAVRDKDAVGARARGLDGSEGSHPGYFWLALNWWNILPACKGCNALRGKLNQFPVASAHQLICAAAAAAAPAGVRYPVPGHPAAVLPDADELDASEDPLLLNPYRDEPEEHLSFTDLGTVAGRTPKGEWSIKVYDLANEDLNRARYEKQYAAETRFTISTLHFRGPQVSQAQAKARALAEFEVAEGVANGSCEFTAAVRVVLGSAGG